MKNKQLNLRRERSLRLEKRDKVLLALDRERGELWKQLRNGPWQLLEEPFQRGWERDFRLSKEALKRKDSRQLRECLVLLDNYEHCRVFPFRCYDWKRKKMVSWKHKLKSFHSLKSLRSGTGDPLFKYFEMSQGRPLSRERIENLVRRGWSGQFFFRYPHYLISETRPHMVTHERVAQPEIERRLGEISRVFQNNNNECRLRKLKNWGSSCWRRMDEKALSLKAAERSRKEMLQAVIDFENLNQNDDWRPVLLLEERRTGRQWCKLN